MCIISRGISNNNDLRDESEYFIINELVDRILFNLISLLKIKGLMTNIESVFIAYEYKLKRLYLRNEDNKYL